MAVSEFSRPARVDVASVSEALFEGEIVIPNAREEGVP